MSNQTLAEKIVVISDGKDCDESPLLSKQALFDHLELLDGQTELVFVFYVKN